MRNASRAIISAFVGSVMVVGSAAGAQADTRQHRADPGAATTAAPEWRENDANTRAFFTAVLNAAKKRQRLTASTTVTITYAAADAPSFSSQIAASASTWNASVSNVRLQATSGDADFTYREGNSPYGSYADTDGHGRGYIFLDYAQNQQYNSDRVVAHETGHVLGLPDHYSGPCSELMSGGGPGPSCQNAVPDDNERARVDELWADGLAGVTALASTAGPRR